MNRTTWRSGMLPVLKPAPVATLLVIMVSIPPAAAATATAQLNVSVTVVASCTIATRLLANPQAALGAPAAMCAGPTGSAIVAQRPVISMEYDTVLGVTRLVFAF